MQVRPTKSFQPLFATLCWLALELVLPARGAVRPTDLRCEYARNPVGVDAARPRLSWVLESSERSQRQAAYQIRVAATSALLDGNEGALWDSGQVKSSQSTHVEYGGVPLNSRQQCWWKARVWDAAGNASDWSSPASWEMGLLRADDWKAKWIGTGPAEEPRPPEGFFKSTKEFTSLVQRVKVDGRSTLLRKSFVADKPIRRAEVYVTGLGYYELSCNGQRVGARGIPHHQRERSLSRPARLETCLPVA